MTDGEVVPFVRNWSGKSSAECIDYWWVSTHGSAWLSEDHTQHVSRTVGDQRVFLILGHWVITSTEQILGDLTIAKGLPESPGW